MRLLFLILSFVYQGKRRSQRNLLSHQKSNCLHPVLKRKRRHWRSQLLEMYLLSCEYLFLDPIGFISFFACFFGGGGGVLFACWLVLFLTQGLWKCSKAVSVLFLLDLSNSVSMQKNKWDATRSLRFNQDAQREDGECRY